MQEAVLPENRRNCETNARRNKQKRDKSSMRSFRCGSSVASLKREHLGSEDTRVNVNDDNVCIATKPEPNTRRKIHTLPKRVRWLIPVCLPDRVSSSKVHLLTSPLIQHSSSLNTSFCNQEDNLLRSSISASQSSGLQSILGEFSLTFSSSLPR